MKFEQEVEEIFKEIEGAVRELMPYPYTYRKNQETFILETLRRLQSAAARTHNWPNAANFSAYVIEIRESVRELCKPKTKLYRGDDYHLVTILSAISKMRHRTCLDLR